MSVSPEILEKLMSLADGQVLYNNLKNSLYYLAQSIATPYDQLVFPVTKGTRCTYDSMFYVAAQTINTEEDFNDAHWGPITVDDFLNAIDEQSHRVENLAKSFAPKYEDLSFPIIMPAFCTFEGRFYTANQDIAVYEDFDPDHWDEVDVANICNYISSLSNALTQKISKPNNPSTGAFMVYDGTDWTAQTLSTWQGGSY